MKSKKTENRDPDMLANFEHIEAFGEPNHVTKEILSEERDDYDHDSEERTKNAEQDVSYITKQIKQDFASLSEEDQEKFLDEIFS